MQDTKEFFEGWLLYQRVIIFNYMRHREIIKLLSSWKEIHRKRALRILDLGCGDAYVARTVFDLHRPTHYCGIDLSSPALGIAREALQKSNWKTTLLEGDLAERIHEVEGPFDLVLAGYSLHHLPDLGKKQVLKAVRSLLSDGAVFILYDILPEPDLSRETFLAQFLKDADATWTQLTAEQLASVREHVETYDFPIALPHWETLAQETGFQLPEVLYRDAKRHYGILNFSAVPLNEE